MSVQLSIFDVLRAPPILRPVDPDGQVVRDEVDYTFILPHPRLNRPYCQVELHQADSGLWMWSTSYSTDDGCGQSYRVGEKWGKFASSSDDALHYAVEELKERLSAQWGAQRGVSQILAWAGQLTLETTDA